MKLDVGCGKRKMGDINADINRAVKPDILCDIHFLPFRNGQFGSVYCYHVLEHKGVSVLKAIKELMRVANSIVEIQVPHWLSPNAKKDKTHVNFQVMRRKFWLQFNPIALTLDYTHIIPFVPFLYCPNSITVRLRKRG